MSHILSIEKLKFSWDSNRDPILSIDNFNIDRAEKIFLYGPSGSGKSTLLNLIAGVLSPQEGKLSVLQTDIVNLKPSQKDKLRGDRMGFIFQTFNLLPYLNVIENILLPTDFSSLKKQKALKTSPSLKEETIRLMQALGLNKDIGSKKVSHLSVGQQQRVAAARALIGSPELVIADEPTSALDAEARSEFLKLLFSECERWQTTLIFVSHDKELGKFFDRQISLPEINSFSLQKDRA